MEPCLTIACEVDIAGNRAPSIMPCAEVLARGAISVLFVALSADRSGSRGATDEKLPRFMVECRICERVVEVDGSSTRLGGGGMGTREYMGEVGSPCRSPDADIAGV